MWPNLKVNDILEIAASTSTAAQANRIEANIANKNNLNLSANLNTSNPVNMNSTNANPNSNYNPFSASGGQFNEDDSSPILLQVVNGSLTDQIPMDTIRIDQVAGQAPFSYKHFNWVNVTVVDKAVFK